MMNAFDAMNELGTMRPTQIAELLTTQKIKGKRHSHVECPLARYMRQCGAINCAIGAKEWAYDNSTAQHYPLPVTVQTFITLFDRGSFAELRG